MPTTATDDQPRTAALTHRECEVLHAVGCGLTDAEIAAEIGLPRQAVAGHVERILTALRLRDRAAAIVHAFDSGMVVPGQGPRRRPAVPVSRISFPRPTGRSPEPSLRISVLGPLRAWRADQPVDLGPIRQQAVLAALALCPDRVVSQQELLDGVWGMESPAGNVVPVYVYRLRKILRGGTAEDAVLRSDRGGYRFAGGVAEVDRARMEEHVSAADAAERAGDLAEAVRACSRALVLFHGEPLAGLPGPFAELERLRLAERRIAIAQRKLDSQLRLGQHAEALAELFALATAQPLNEPVAAMLMFALHRCGRRADALDAFNRVRRHLAEDLGVCPGERLRRTHQAVLRDDAPLVDRARTRIAS